MQLQSTISYRLLDITINLFKYSWFKSRYTNGRSEEFKNPAEFCFEQSSKSCNIENCKNIAIVRCSWCKLSLCLKHCFIERTSLL